MTDATDSEMYPLLNPSFTPLAPDETTLHLVTSAISGPTYTLTAAREDGALTRLPELMDGTRTVAEIAAALGSEEPESVRSMIHGLEQKNIVLDATETDHPPVSGYTALHPSMLQDRIEEVTDADVLVVGADEPIEWAVDDLHEYGVARLRVTSTERSTEADRRAVADGADEVVYDERTLAEIVDDIDLVIAVERLPGEQLLRRVNEHAVEAGTPLVTGTVDGVSGTVGPTVVPGRTACFECYRTRLAANTASEAFESYRSTAGSDGGVFTAFERIITGYTTLAGLNYLLSGAGFTVGSQITFDFFDWSVEVNDVLKLPRCECCGPVAQPNQRFIQIEQLYD